MATAKFHDVADALCSRVTQLHTAECGSAVTNTCGDGGVRKCTTYRVTHGSLQFYLHITSGVRPPPPLQREFLARRSAGFYMGAFQSLMSFSLPSSSPDPQRLSECKGQTSSSLSRASPPVSPTAGLEEETLLLGNPDSAPAAEVLSAASKAALTVTSSPLPKIQIRHLTKETPEGIRLLDNISADISRACITALIGPSGSGKSTILRALNRLWEPGKGSVLLDGVDVISLPPVQLRRRVGMLFQTAHLFEGTVADNVRYGPSLAGKHLSDAEVWTLLDLAHLDRSFSEKHVGGLSGGQAQRVALARALALQPEVLLLDEPTSALDPSATAKIEESIQQLRQVQRLTVVWVSHSAEQVQRVADCVALVVGGRLVDTFQAVELHSGEHTLAERFMAGKLESMEGAVMNDVEV